MTHAYNNFNKVLSLLFDYVILNISLITVYNFTHQTFTGWMSDKTHVNIILILNLLWLLSTNIIQLYAVNYDSPFKILKKSVTTFIFYVVSIGFVVFYLSNLKSYSITKDYLFLSVSLFGLLFGSYKLILLNWIKYPLINNGKLRKAVIVGGGRAGLELFHQFKNNSRKGYEVVGIFDDQPLKVPAAHLYLGDTSSCMTYVKANNVDEIFCALSFAENKTIERLIKESDKNMVRFKLIPEHYEYFQGSLVAKSLDQLDVFSIRVEPLENVANRALKRLFDILFSSFVLIFILSWLYPIIYLLIKLESEGLALFVQSRSGRDNTAFNCYKFRSMRVNSDSNKRQATKGDSRITKIGAFLRKTSLDEMPQFFNVLMGHMSVVGPRPHMLSHTEEYSKLIDQFMVRHFIKPGITGWAQIQGLRGETKLLEDMHARVEADVWYMENWSFALDIRIIFATFFKAIIGDKYAY